MTKAEQREQEQQLEQLREQMWVHLKAMSKKELMRLILEQSDFIIEAQKLNKHLFDENNQLKAQQSKETKEPQKENE